MYLPLIFAILAYKGVLSLIIVALDILSPITGSSDTTLFVGSSSRLVYPSLDLFFDPPKILFLLIVDLPEISYFDSS